VTDINEILDERNGRYGNYIDQATIAQNVRAALQFKTSFAPDQEDALHMIAVKLSRICNGDPDYADNWRDIAGYATLVADRLEGKIR
jgi:hypothetical protein